MRVFKSLKGESLTPKIRWEDDLYHLIKTYQLRGLLVKAIIITPFLEMRMILVSKWHKLAINSTALNPPTEAEK